MNKLTAVICLSAFSLCPSLIMAQWTRVGGELQGADYYLVAFRFLNRSANDIHVEKRKHLLTCSNILLTVGISSANPVVDYYYKFIHDTDTMWISFKTIPCSNYFIDSIVFKSGFFKMELERDNAMFSSTAVKDFFSLECIGSKLRPPRREYYPNFEYKLHPDIELYYHWVSGLKERERYDFE